MKQSVTVVCHHECGRPEEVVRVERWPLEDIKPSEALVLMKASPVNPADLNVLEGHYAIQSALPAVVGLEGVGVVAQKGIAVSEVRPGQLVIRPGFTGAWCEAYVAPARELVVVPPGIDADLASMCTSTLPTAWRMLHDFVALNRGDWVIQNAANSAVGRCVIQLARQRWFKTVNIVRRPELKKELETLGATVVVTEEELANAGIASFTGGADMGLGLNAVGGASAHLLAGAVRRGGTVVTYGAMARQPLHLRNADLIFRDLTFRGFWMSDWYRRVSGKEIAGMFAQLFPMVRGGAVRIAVERTYPLEEAREAVLHAARPGRSGKILFVMN